MLAAATASSSGFVLAPAFVDADGNVTREYGSLAAMQRDALRWTLPRDPEDDGGLGGSLTFAIDPMLCARLDFRDRVGPIAFIGCNDVTFTTYRVFDTWEGGSFSAPDDESDEGPPVQQSFARRGSALLGAIGRRFSGQVEMGVGVV